MDGCDCFEFTFESSVTILVFCDGTILRMVGGDLVLVYRFTVCIIMPSYIVTEDIIVYIVVDKFSCLNSYILTAHYCVYCGGR